MRDVRLWPDVLRAPVLTLVTGYESVAMVNMAPMLVGTIHYTDCCQYVVNVGENIGST